MRKIKYIFIHNSSSSRDKTTKKDIYQWHVVEKGWSDVGYHMMINGKGKLLDGRKDKIMGAHVRGLNKESLGVCLFGNFYKEKPSKKQMESLEAWLTDKCEQYNIEPRNILGHRDSGLIKENAKTSKSCPGENLYKLIPQLRGKVKQNLKLIEMIEIPVEKPVVEKPIEVEKKPSFFEVILELINKLLKKE